jgi:hypothetical protein
MVARNSWSSEHVAARDGDRLSKGRSLRAEDKSERTVKSYTEAVGLLAEFLAARGHPLL